MNNCPICETTWEGREIPQALYETGCYESKAAAEKAARNYGWSPENSLREGINHVGIQYPPDHAEHFDGVSEWLCAVCGARIGRFTGKLLLDGQYEPYDFQRGDVELYRTPHAWCEIFNTHIIDWDGWRDGIPITQPIRALDFVDRWAQSTAVQPGSPLLNKLLDIRADRK